MQLRGRLAQAQLDVAQFVAGALELGREPLERCDRTLGERDETGRAVALVGGERLGGSRCRLRELRYVTQPLALGAQHVLPARLHAVGVLDERAQLIEARRRDRGVLGQLLEAPSRSHELAPSRTRGSTALQLLVAAEPVEHLELVRRPRKPPLLELTRHRHNRLDCSSHVLARRRPAPRVRARAAVAEHAPRHEQGVLVLRAEVGQLLEVVGQVELGLDVGLRTGGPDERIAALRPEQQPDRLREDRLPRARLARDRVQPGRELELGLPDEHEILDSQAAEHARSVVTV